MSNPFIDLTGTMSQGEIDQKNIEELMQKLNDQENKLNSVTQTLNIVGYGSKNYVWDGTIPGAVPFFQDYVVIPVAITSSIFVLGFMSRSDLPNRFYSLPYQEVFVNGNNDGVLSKSFASGADYGQKQVYVNLQFYATGAPVVFTFYYYLIQQPANVS